MAEGSRAGPTPGRGSVGNPAATVLAGEPLASLDLTLPTCQMGQSLLGLQCLRSSRMAQGPGQGSEGNTGSVAGLLAVLSPGSSPGE